MKDVAVVMPVEKNVMKLTVRSAVTKLTWQVVI
jgi:hypothetical protein